MADTVRPDGPRAPPADVAQLRPHDHLCHLYETAEEQTAVAAEYLAAALGRGERALLAVPPHARAASLAALSARGVDVDGAAARGALRALSSGEAYLPDGRFDPERQVRFWGEQTEAARRDGFAALAVSAEMDWALSGAPGCEALVRYEAGLGRPSDLPASAVCHYDRTRFPPELLVAMLRSHALVLHGGRVLQNPYVQPAEAAFTPEPPARELERLLATMRERDAAEAALRASERRHRLLAERLQDIVFRWRLDPPGLEYVSPAVTAITGYTPEEHYADPDHLFPRLVHPEDRPKLTGPLEERTGQLLTIRFVRKDGRTVWTEHRNVLVRDEQGRPVAIEGVVRDVTSRVEAEASLREREAQLRQAARLASVGTLAAGVAHEVNNPLAYVIGNIGFVEESLGRLGQPDPPDVDELRAALRDALEGAARVKAIVHELRHFATPPRTQGRGGVDLYGQVAAAVSLVHAEVEPRARLRLELPPALPPLAATDREIVQVLVSLLLNAAQAIPDGRPDEHEVVLSAEARERRVLVRIRDTGAGISPEHLPRIFDPFFTTRPTGAGAGLGLSISHTIVTALGGTIGVRSEPGRGTTFEVAFPAAAPAAGAPAPAAPAGPPPQAGPARPRVLVVDDEPLVGKSLGRLLGAAYDVTLLTSGVEALRRAREGESWDLVLCDLMMPELTGMDLEAALAAERPELARRMVFLTGGAFTERSRAFLASCRTYLEKPVEPAALRALVAERIASRR